MTQRGTGLGSLILAALLMIPGCATFPTASPTTNYVLAGAAAGTVVGSGIGCLTAYDIDHDDPTTYAIGCTGGAVIGAIVGGTGAYLLGPPPPPPPVKVAQAPPPPAPPPPPPPPSPPPPKVLVIRGVNFDFNRSEIRPEDEPKLEEYARVLKENPDILIYADGYCDIVGSVEYNLRLSERRADSVVIYLEGEGVPARRMTARGFGKTNFVASNDTAEGRAQNRRVELAPVK